MISPVRREVIRGTDWLSVSRTGRDLKLPETVVSRACARIQFIAEPHFAGEISSAVTTIATKKGPIYFSNDTGKMEVRNGRK